MSCFNKVSTVTAMRDLDLTKHVNYTSGMILGVDDFTQEFAYLAGRDRWLTRDVLGYGTVSGLKVRIDTDAAKGARVMVEPGAAISPRGQLICVSTAQCAFLNDWLAANKEEIIKRFDEPSGSPPASSPPATPAALKLFVVLCYRDCPVDHVPIPGEPCRNDTDLLEPSRIQDDFSLELRFAAPKQPEEDNLRRFAAWLRQISIVETGDSTPPDEFSRTILETWNPPEASPPVSPPVILSPPADLRINVGELTDYMRIAFRLWVTELRKVLSERKTGCAVEMTGGKSFEDCVLLGELLVPLVEVSNGLKVSDSEPVSLDEEKRPFLLHLRMLQEWMLANFSDISGGAPPPVTSPPAPVSLALDELTDVDAASPLDGQVLTFDGGQWTAKDPPTGGGGVSDHGALVGLADDDHPQYLLIDGTRALTGSLDAGGNRVTNLTLAQNNGEAVIFEQAIKTGDAAGGDLAGNYPNPTINLLQGKPLQAAAPNNGDMLVWNGAAWTPQPQPQIPPPPAAKPELILPLATITRVDNTVYEIWFNIDAPGNLARVSGFKESHLRILDETDAPPPFTAPVRCRIVPRIRNVFFATLVLGANQPEPDRMRFNFDIREIAVEVTVNNAVETLSLMEYAEKNNIRFAGFLEGRLATVFVRGTGVAG